MEAKSTRATSANRGEPHLELFDSTTSTYIPTETLSTLPRSLEPLPHSSFTKTHRPKMVASLRTTASLALRGKQERAPATDQRWRGQQLGAFEAVIDETETTFG